MTIHQTSDNDNSNGGDPGLFGGTSVDLEAFIASGSAIDLDTIHRLQDEEAHGIFADHWRIYYDLGWPVFPLGIGWSTKRKYYEGKKKPPPIGVTGRAGVNASEGLLEYWAKIYPHANIGVRAPHFEDFWVKGFDVDEHDEKHGFQELQTHEMVLGKLPPTYVSSARDVATGHGIRWYKVPVGTIFPGNLSPSIEVVQHHHRYAAAWPSTNPHAGAATYKWYSPDGHVSDPPRPQDLTDLRPQP